MLSCASNVSCEETITLESCGKVLGSKPIVNQGMRVLAQEHKTVLFVSLSTLYSVRFRRTFCDCRQP